MNLFSSNGFLTTMLGDIPDQPSFPSGFFEKIIPNLWAFLVQLFALIVMIIAFFFLAYKPVRKILEKRKNHVEEEINEAERKNASANVLLKESQDKLDASKLEASKIIEDAKERAEKLKAESILKTDEEIQMMKRKADEDILASKENAKEEIRKEIIDVALLASKEILNREVNEKDNSKLVDNFIKDMDKEK